MPVLAYSRVGRRDHRGDPAATAHAEPSGGDSWDRSAQDFGAEAGEAVRLLDRTDAALAGARARHRNHS